jgi:cell division protein FtsZ
MKETREIMNHIRSFAAEDATVIFGTAYDEAMGDELRVTVVATGLGRAASKPTLVHSTQRQEALRTGTDDYAMPLENADSRVPSVMRNPRTQASAQVRALETSGMEHYDIPAFLRRQAD